METSKIDKAISFYKEEEKKMLSSVNTYCFLKGSKTINIGEKLKIIYAKIEALELAKNN